MPGGSDNPVPTEPPGGKSPGRSGVAHGLLPRRLFKAAAGPVGLAVVSAGTPVTIHEAAVAGVAAMVAAQLQDLLPPLVEKVRQGQSASAAAMLGLAAGYSKLTAGEILERADQDPYLRRVVSEAISAAADATYYEKIQALGAVLGRALTATQLMEQGKLISQAVVLRVLEAVHAVTLVTISEEAPDAGTDADGPWQGWTYATLQQRLELGVLGTPVVETLLAQGLIRESGHRPENPELWETTLWGDKIIGLLEEAASADPEETTVP